MIGRWGLSGETAKGEWTRNNRFILVEDSGRRCERPPSFFASIGEFADWFPGGRGGWGTFEARNRSWSYGRPIFPKRSASVNTPPKPIPMNKKVTWCFLLDTAPADRLDSWSNPAARLP